MERPIIISNRLAVSLSQNSCSPLLCAQESGSVSVLDEHGQHAVRLSRDVHQRPSPVIIPQVKQKEQKLMESFVHSARCVYLMMASFFFFSFLNSKKKREKKNVLKLQKCFVDKYKKDNEKKSIIIIIRL